MSNDSDVDRRKVLAGITAGVAGVSLAGCVEGDETEDQNQEEAMVARPEPPAQLTADAQTMKYIAESAQYQNQMLEKIEEQL